jgi:hypothetical protein
MAAFRMQNEQGDRITGCNIPPGLQEHQSAYWSELGGILGILVLLDLLQQHCALTTHQFIITWDCKGAGLKSMTYHQPPTANNDNYDLLTEVHRIKTQPTIEVVYWWVEGHQAECLTLTTGQIRPIEWRNGQISKTVLGRDKRQEFSTTADCFWPWMDCLD